MVFTVTLHMARVFYTGAYKPPREFNWVVGVILLFLTLGLSFTGYLLPWDQLAIWAVTVGTSLAGYSPFVAKQANFMLLGRGGGRAGDPAAVVRAPRAGPAVRAGALPRPCTSGGSARTAGSPDRCRRRTWHERKRRSTRRPTRRSWPRSSAKARTDVSPRAGPARLGSGPTERRTAGVRGAPPRRGTAAAAPAQRLPVPQTPALAAGRSRGRAGARQHRRTCRRAGRRGRVPSRAGREAPAPTGNVPEPKRGAPEKHRLLALVPPEGIQRVEREQGDRINVWPHLLIEEFISLLVVSRAW